MKLHLALLLLLFNLLQLNAQDINFEHIGSVNGLSQVSVLSIYQDEIGYMWFGTEEGLNRYDGKDIDVFRASENDKFGLTNNVINKIYGDHNGFLYLLCGYKDLVSYNCKKNVFKLLNDKCQTICQGRKNLWFSSDNKIMKFDFETKSTLNYYSAKTIRPITKLLETSINKLYIGTESGLYLLDENKMFNEIISNENITAIYEDIKKNIWIGTLNNGVFKINTTGLIEHYSHDLNTESKLSSNYIRDFCEDNYGQIWIATFVGLDKLTPDNGKIINYRNYGDKPTDLSHTSIYSIFKDKQNTLWIGTYFGGVNFHNPEYNIYSYYYPNPNQPTNLNFPIVGKIAEDNAGNLWICTEGGGLNFFDRKNRTFHAFKAGEPNSVSHNNLKSIWFNSQNNKLYIGTIHGDLNIYDISTKRFKNITLLKNAFSTNNVLAMCPHDGQLYILTQNGIMVLDMKTETASPLFLIKKKTKNIGNHLSTMLIDSKQNLWVALGNGALKCFNLTTEKLNVYTHDYDKSGTIGRHVITRGFQNRQGKIFFATRGSGLFEYLPEKNSFKHYSVEDNGLLSNFIYDITETTYGYLVLLTNKGVNLFDAKSNKSICLDKNRGLPLDIINVGCGVYSTKIGEIFIGGATGMASFFENQINPTPKEYNLFFSELYVNNQVVRPGDNTGILETALNYVRELKLNYNQNNFSVKFASSNYIKANKTNFEYRLKGLNDQWSLVTDQTLKYTNLSPGNYELNIREIQENNSKTAPKEINLQIKISPPFYASWLAYIFYLTILVAAAWKLYMFNNSKITLRTSLDYELRENERIKDLNQTKLQFFTNISHEFRTPLTLIIGQIESIIQMQNISPTIHSKLTKIYKNASHLRNLITELLDFRKQEKDLLALKVSNQDIVSFTKNTFASFHEMAISGKIDYNFITTEQNITLWFDPLQLQKVFYNLISNAFRYSPPNSSITVKIERESDIIIISIIDSGIGIPAADLPKIFNRFYQAKNQPDNNLNMFSTGVGLALSKGIIELHHGSIEAFNNVEKGTTFRVALLEGNEHFTEEEITTYSEMDLYNTHPDFNFDSIPTINDKENHKTTILIVEDNEEMLHFLIEVFTPIYHVETAMDGLEGLEKAKELQPQIILSDVMMPNMGGKEMCQKLKTNLETSHIPIVLLTAATSDEQNIEGLMMGADDYITKPFNLKILISRCNNLVLGRIRMQEKYSKTTVETPIPLATNLLDQKILKKATEIVMNHLDDFDFDISTFANEMALGRSNLYLKLKGITGMTPNDFILNIRLKEAANLLLKENDLNVSDITYRLGFGTPRYFSKCFKDLFGMTPLNYRKINNPSSINTDDVVDLE